MSSSSRSLFIKFIVRDSHIDIEISVESGIIAEVKVGGKTVTSPEGNICTGANGKVVPFARKTWDKE